MDVNSADGHDELITLAELTRRTGVSVRNIRFYTTRGLLRPPIRHGRSGYYSRDHLARLELVKELQAHGFTLSAIEKYVGRIHRDASPEQIALHRLTLQPWLVEHPTLVSRRGLAGELGRKVDAELLRKLGALGVVTASRGRYVVNRAQLVPALRLIDLGIPLELLTASQEIYRTHGAAIADELGVLFREKLWPAYREGTVATEQLVSMLENFQPVSVAALVEAFSQAMTEARRAEVARRTS